MPRATVEELEEETREAWQRADNLYYDYEQAMEYARRMGLALHAARKRARETENG